MTGPSRPQTAVLLLASVTLGSAASLPGKEVGTDTERTYGQSAAVEVARSCPGWKVERQEVLAERGVLPRSDPAPDMLSMDGAVDREYRRGLTDA